MPLPSTSLLAAMLLAAIDCGAQALDLNLAGDPGNVTISGVSSGAAMAVQYAVAHSASIAGVASIAGPPWGCAQGEAGRAIGDCMCGGHSVASQIDRARSLVNDHQIDSWQTVDGPPKKLRRSYVFQSEGDDTVKPGPGQTTVDFLTDFIKQRPVVDPSAAHPSNRAEHGMISPDGKDSCYVKNANDSYIRNCGNEDNAGKLFNALLYPGRAYTPPPTAPLPVAVLRFDQQVFIEAVKQQVATDDFAGDLVPGDFPNLKSPPRNNFDMAEHGYIYIPPDCKASDAKCGVHIALHGCRQDVKTFAEKAGYNRWAEAYKIIVIYPALKAVASANMGEVCSAPLTAAAVVAASAWPKFNPNSCWDWWGYLDLGFPYHNRYLTKAAPQIKVIELIIKAATRAKP